MMFKKKMKDNVEKKFDTIFKNPSFVEKPLVKKQVPLRNKLIPILSGSLTLLVASIIIVTIVVPKGMKNDSNSINQSSSSLTPNTPNETFFTSKTDNPSLAICEAIDYPEPKTTYQDTDVYNVDIMVANLYYGQKYDGSTGLLVGAEDNPGYSFDAINISLNNSNKQLIADYSVDMNEYPKQENGILRDEKNINKDDFKLTYSFNLIELINGNYDDNIHFEVNYVESGKTGYVADTRIFGRSFSLHLKKDQSSISLNDLEFDNKASTNQLPEGDIHYMDVIDLFSNQPVDYQNPNYVDVQLKWSDSYIYFFDGSEGYDVLTKFDGISLMPCPFSLKEMFDQKISDYSYLPITICASFHYKGKTEFSRDVLANFYVFKDGSLLMHDNRDIFYYYSDSGAIDYEEFYNYFK